MYLAQNISFLKVSGQTDIRFEISVKNYIFQHGTKYLLIVFAEQIGQEER